MVTFDTNILVYATAPVTPQYRARARDLLSRGARGGRSVLLFQTLIEFSSVALRKSGMPIDQVSLAVDNWRASIDLECAVDEDLPEALRAVANHKLPFWDALLWATARRVGVQYLLSEDFQDGRLLGGVRFVNPFNPAHDALIDRIWAPD